VIDLGVGLNSDFAFAERREWLVTNGIGGFAMGTIAGMLTRRYHGLLIAATRPPLGRRLLVTKLDELISYRGESYPLTVNRWASDVVDLAGYNHLRGFQMVDTVPVWSYTVSDALLEKSVWMQHGANTTYVRYSFVDGTGPLEINIKVLLNDRDYHGVTNEGYTTFDIENIANGLEIKSSASGNRWYLLSEKMSAEVKNQWYGSYYLTIEKYRGLPEVESHYYGAKLSVIINPGESATLVTSTEPYPELDGAKAYNDHAEREQELMRRANWPTYGRHRSTGDTSEPSASVMTKRLILAADQFIVSRSSERDSDGQTVIAGYPWFGDWGRDTMIALPGLTLSTGRVEIAAKILRTFASYVDRGMLPNRFPDDGEEPVYNTADASLWYFEALRAYHEHTHDLDLIDELFPVLSEIIDWHIKGTRHNIGLDLTDGLVFAGEPGVQLTWMDAKVGSWVVTPRIGKPIEINALWYHALNIMARFAEQLDKEQERYKEHAQSTLRGFRRYWNQEAGYCYDVLDGPEGHDHSLRPNQILAVSLPYSPLSPDQRRAVVDVCEEQLLAPFGLRSLSPDHAEYRGIYGGDVESRDGAYHQGTVWSWLIGPFVTAHLRVYGDAERAREFLRPLLEHTADYGIGSVSEIFDGDAPHHPRGCPAQAWGVAELLRVLSALLISESGQES
jgi:predicted glycogen debranching enzyme